MLIGLAINSKIAIREDPSAEMSEEQARENAKSILMAEYNKVYSG